SDFLASGTEWRTQPLWGIGLIATVNDHTFLLHDGRARNVEEAILWHGGEAEQPKQDFIDLSSEERSQLIAFINTL
ncbi:MAG: di-heme oxidoredictase family protein, partial [Flavobacteriaceae bacterium]